MNDLLPPLTVHLLDLFQGPLRDVRFPDADGERLGAAVDAAAAAHEALARAEAAVEAARSVLTDKQRFVAQETERAIAYARVYANDHPELRATLDALTTRPANRRGPGRPRKVAITASDATDATLGTAAE
jgi:hypothetical protein